MFDLGATELLLIAVVAIVVIGPKDMPLALRTAGRWMGKMRRISGHFRSGLDTMIREAEVEDMEKKWRDQNDQIMRDHPEGIPSDDEMSGALESAEPPALEPSDPPAPAKKPPAKTVKPAKKPAKTAKSAKTAKPASGKATKPASGKATKPASGKAKGVNPQLPLDSPPTDS